MPLVRKMKPEPLKDKNKLIQKEIVDLLMKHKVRLGVITKVIAKLCRIESNRKQAVEWLKKELPKEVSKGMWTYEIYNTIDESFKDETKDS